MCVSPRQRTWLFVEEAWSEPPNSLNQVLLEMCHTFLQNERRGMKVDELLVEHFPVKWEKSMETGMCLSQVKRFTLG